MGAKPIAIASVLLLALSLSARAADPVKPARPGDATGKPVQYWDGARQRTAWLSADLIAEFGASRTAAIAGTRGSTERAETVRLWEVDAGKDAESVLSKARAADPSRQLSEVLREGKTSSRHRALPGNVIVELDSSFAGEKDAKRWADGRRLEIVSRVAVGPSTWEVKSAPGLASIELANSLVGTPGVVTASPVWWLELTTR